MADEDYKQAKADEKAARKRARALRPWYKKKRFILGIPIVAIVILGVIGSAVSPTEDEAPQSDAAAATAGTTVGSSPEATTVAVAETAQSSATAATQAATPAPTRAATPEPTPTPAGFGDGTQRVGTQIQAGRYRTRNAGSLCYWARLSGFTGSLDEVIANDTASSPKSLVVDILPTDAGFQSRGCGRWTSDLSPVTSSPTSDFGDGTWIVGVDVAPGTWSTPGDDLCYWARLSGFTGEFDELTANDVSTSGGAVVTILPTDVGFATSGCGTWTHG